jgi:hypothetical protein
MKNKTSITHELCNDANLLLCVRSFSELISEIEYNQKK